MTGDSGGGSAPGPADVEQFAVGRGADYGQVSLSWSNGAITVLACTNRTYTTNATDWFVLASGVSSPWTHTAASNYPSVYYKIVSGNYTSTYDVGKYDVQVASGIFTGTTPSAWNDPTRGAELAKGQFDRGVDVVFAAAGGTGTGVYQAAKDSGKLAIGVDSNQNHLQPGTVLTSMVKRVDLAVYDALKTAKEGTWKPGRRALGCGRARRSAAATPPDAPS